MRLALLITNLLICLLSANLWADSLSNVGNANSSAANSFNLEEPSFLDVDEAYDFQSSIKNQTLQFHWEIADGYYLYRQQLSVKINQQTIDLGNIPTGKTKIDEYFGEVQVYYHDLSFELAAEKPIQAFEVEYQGCADAGLCYAPRTRFFEIDDAGNILERDSAKQLIKAADKNLAQEPSEIKTLNLTIALLFGFIGGLILNVMPCVFPVLGLKLFSLTGSAHKKQHAWIYTLGVISSFLATALLLISLKAAGEQIGWGFQLQSPLFLWFLAYLFTILGLNMSGYIFFGASLMGVGGKLTADKGVKGDFFTGVLAVVVASPCSVPFMGSALGFAMTQSTFTAMLVFLALGFGMASPFLLIAYFPWLQKALPKPGVWMDTFKQLLAFPLYLTVIWLLWVMGRQTGITQLAIALSACLAIVFCCWLLKHKNKLSMAIFAVTALLIAYLPFISATPPENSHWQPYSAEILAEAQAANRTIFINATADWCITCISNELSTLDDEELLALFEKNQVLLLKADWTKQDPEISKLLSSYQRSGVPLYLWFTPNSDRAKVLPQILSRTQFLELME